MAKMKEVGSRDTYTKGATQGFVEGANSQINTREEGDEEYITKFNETTDAATNAITGQYQGRIDKAPDKFQGQYDANAVAQAVQRKQLEESMANMGLTSSGLNASNQTALAVQRMNADASTRAQQQNYVSELESAIDQAVAQGEYAKSTNANETRHETHNWATDLLSQAYRDGQIYGRDDYNTDLNSAWNQYMLDTEVEQADIDRNWQKVMQEDAQKYGIKLAGINHGYSKELAGINHGYSKELAGINYGYQDDLQTKSQNWQSNENAKYKTTGTGSSGTDYLSTIASLGNAFDMDYPTAAAVIAAMTDTGDPAKNTYNANYATALQSGYNANEATIYAKAGGGEAGRAAVGKAQVQAAGIDTGKLTSFQTTSVFENLMSDDQKYNSTVNWSSEKWSTSIRKAAEEATQNAKSSGLTGDAEAFAVAEAVGKAYANIPNDDDVATRCAAALKKQFSGVYADIALKAANLQLIPANTQNNFRTDRLK